jgi:hypothetical protein
MAVLSSYETVYLWPDAHSGRIASNCRKKK